MNGMRMFRRGSLAALMAGMFLAMAASPVALAKKGGGGGGGGKPGGGVEDIALDVSFNCLSGSCALGGDGVGTTYSDGQDRVTAVLTSNGHINFGVGARKNRVPPRNLFWDFSLGPVVGLSTSGSTEAYQTSDDIPYIYGSKIQVNRRGSLDLREMDIDEDINLDVDWWGDITIFDSGSPTIVSHRLDALTGSNNNAQDECSPEAGSELDDAMITRTGEATWKLTVDATMVSCTLIQDPDDPAGNLREEYRQVGPFEIVFEAQQ